ncbi:MAG: hypothetical protein IPP69_12735 [Flavobacteriales bacterium]|nr:hypothetical protein [Flavobacteriales bacterium]
MIILNARIAVFSLMILLMVLMFVPPLHGQTTLQLKCEKEEIDAFCRSDHSYSDIVQIDIEGSGHDVNWNKLARALAELPALCDLRLLNNSFEALPKGISSLKKLNELTVIGSDELPMESCLNVFADLPLLKKITWELYELDAVPFDIILLEQVDTVVIVDGQLADLRKFYPDVLTDQELEHRFSKMAVPATLVSTVPIEVEFITLIEQIPEAIRTEDHTTEVTDYFDLRYHRARKIDPPAEPWTRLYTHVIPPLENVQIEKEFFEVECETPTIVCSEKGGTQVIIPPNSFVDVNGNPVIGNVLVEYREFLDVADQILSGIPMSFTEDDDVSLFRSAGMFEINASKDGSEIFLKENAQMTINFHSVDSLDRFQFYAFNDTSNTWVDLGNANLGRVDVNLEEYNYSSAAHFYNGWIHRGNTLPRPDTTLFAQRYESLCYTHTRRDLKTYESGIEYGYWKVRSHELRLKKIRRSKGRVIFTLEGSYSGNPEMKKIHVDDWRLVSNISVKILRKDFHRKRLFCDIRILEGDGCYVLQLKDDTSFSHLQVMPLKSYRKKGRTYYEDRDLKLDAYKKALATREKQFNKGLNKYNRLFIRKAIKRNENWVKWNWSTTRAMMTIEEKKMNQVEWDVYCDSIQRLERQDFAMAKVNAASFTRSLSIDGFGIYNCDQIERLQNPVVIAASYENQSGNRVDGKCTYVIDRNINGVLTYDGYRQMSPKRFALDPESVQAIVVVDKNGQIGIVDINHLKTLSLEDQGRYTLKLESVETPLSVTEFRNLIGI